MWQWHVYLQLTETEADQFDARVERMEMKRQMSYQAITKMTNKVKLNVKLLLCSTELSQFKHFWSILSKLKLNVKLLLCSTLLSPQLAIQNQFKHFWSILSILKLANGRHSVEMVDSKVKVRVKSKYTEDCVYCAHTHTHIYIYIYTYIHTYTYTLIQKTYSHTYTHT